MSDSIPACKDCKHFVYSPDPIFSECQKYFSESYDYLEGQVYRKNSLCIHSRSKEEYCGTMGKDFEPKDPQPNEIILSQSKKSLPFLDWFFN